MALFVNRYFSASIVLASAVLPVECPWQYVTFGFEMPQPGESNNEACSGAPQMNPRQGQRDEAEAEKEMIETKSTDSDAAPNGLKLAVELPRNLTRGIKWPLRVVLANVSDEPVLVYHTKDSRDLTIRVFNISEEEGNKRNTQVMPTKHGINAMHQGTVPLAIPYYTTSIAVHRLEPEHVYEWSIGDFEKYYELSPGVYLFEFTASAKIDVNSDTFSSVTLSVECKVLEK
jgi:hypothetical protein